MEEKKSTTLKKIKDRLLDLKKKSGQVPERVVVRNCQTQRESFKFFVYATNPRFMSF